MSFITAARIHNGRKWLPENTVIEIADDGTIIALHNKEDVVGSNIVFYEGVLTPGFVNAHCHLELSHMRGALPEHTGLVPFLQTVTFHRNDFTDEQKLEGREHAYQELVNNGIVAVGDIANTADSMDLRALDTLHIHTFVEAIGFAPEHAATRFEHSAKTYNEYADQERKEKRLHQSIVPHAPYSVSAPLFGLIDAYHPTSIVSIHNQESDAENQYFFNKQGDIKNLLQGFKIDDTFFEPSGKTSIQTYHEYFTLDHSFLFVHNTFTSEEDIRYIKGKNCDAYWCLCPNANLYIEGRLPDVPMFVSNNANICIGTDSLASNHELSVLSELQTLKQSFPQLSWETLFTWGTYNGACALQMQDVVGSLAAGLKPGVVQVVGLEDGEKATIKRTA